MCAAYSFGGRIFRPGKEVPVVTARGHIRLPWAGFARAEILAWWLGKGGEPVDLPAVRFAERSQSTGRLIWEDIPEGLVIRGLAREGTVRVVTRSATPEEIARFDHPRMPVLEVARFPMPAIPLPPQEPDLFGWQS